MQTEVSMQVNTNSDNAEKTMAALIRDKLQVIDQQQQQLRESRDEINLLKRTVALAETQAQELSMWRKKEPLLKRLENMVQQSEASEGVKSAQLAEVSYPTCSTATHMHTHSLSRAPSNRFRRRPRS
jgi:hypothetical protein